MGDSTYSRPVLLLETVSLAALLAFMCSNTALNMDEMATETQSIVRKSAERFKRPIPSPLVVGYAKAFQ